MPRRRDRRNPLSGIGWIALALAVVAPPAVAQDRGACVSSNVPEAFKLPDGTLHAAGRLTLCTMQALNPVTGLHRMWPEDGGASLVMSRRARAEALPDSPPALLFQCAPGEPLDLTGYVLSDGHRSWRYALRRANPGGFAGSRAPRAAPPGDEPTNPLP